MPFGELSGQVKDWTQKDIDDAKSAGLFFKPYTALRDYGTSKGYTVDWDSNSGNVKINNVNYTSKQLTDSGFQNYNGRWMGSDNNINKFFSGISTAKPTPMNTTISTANTTPSKPSSAYDYTPLSQTPNFQYTYAAGSAQGPATLQQAYKPTGGGTVNIAPATPTSQTNVNQSIDYNQLSEIMSKKLLEKMPQISQYKPYQSAFDNQMIDALNKIQNYKAFDFNENNPALKQAQQQAMGAVRQDMAKRGRVFDTYADVKMQEAAQGLIPSYYQMEQNQYNKDRANMYDILTAIQNADNTAYNRYNQGYVYDKNNEMTALDNVLKAQDYGNNQANTQFNRDVATSNLTGQFQNQDTISYQQQQRNNKLIDEEKIKGQELQDFGVVLSPVMRQYRQVFQSMPQNLGSQIIQLGNQSGGFAAEINKRMEINPNDPLIPYLQAARAMKVLSNPELLQQFGAEYGMQSLKINQIAQQEIINKLEVLKKQIDSEKSKFDLEKVIAEIRKNNADAAIKELEASYLPQKLKAEIALELEKIRTEKAQQSNYAANAAESYAGAKMKNKEMNKADNASTIAGAAYQEFLSSKKSPEEWLNSDKNAEALGKAGALKDFIGILKSTGKFNDNSFNNLLKESE